MDLRHAVDFIAAAMALSDSKNGGGGVDVVYMNSYLFQLYGVEYLLRIG